MYVFLASLLVLGTQALEFPVASEKNCTPGENYVQFTGSIFVKDCRKFGNRFVSKYVGCAPPSREYLPIGESYDEINTFKFGYRMACSNDGAGGIRYGPQGCLIDGHFVDFGKDQLQIEEEFDRGFKMACVKTDEGSFQIQSKGCLLAPGTEDEVSFNLGELKKIEILDEYCKCSQNGFNLYCARDAKFLQNL